MRFTWKTTQMINNLESYNYKKKHFDGISCKDFVAP